MFQNLFFLYQAHSCNLAFLNHRTLCNHLIYWYHGHLKSISTAFLSFLRKSLNLFFFLTYKASCPLYKVSASSSDCDPFSPTLPLTQLLCPLLLYSLTLPLHFFIHFLPNFSESDLFLLLLFLPSHLHINWYLLHGIWFLFLPLDLKYFHQ